MINSKFYRVLSLVLAFVMTVSLFSNWSMPVFATSGVKSSDLAPVISTTLKGEVTLYSDVKDGAPSVDITCEEEINVELYKKFVVEETGKIFYGFYVTGKVSDKLAEIFEEYHFIHADDVGLSELETTPEPTVESSVEPILDTLEDNPISNDVTTGNFNVDEEGNYYIAHTTGIIVKSADEKMATVRNITVEPVSKANGNIPVGSADYLIWNNSLFCDITLTDENGNEVYLDGTVDVIFPKDIVPFKVETDHTKSYYTYRFDDDGTVYSNGTYEYKPDTDLVATYDGLSVVGFAAVVFEKNGSFSWFDEPFEVVSKGKSINLYSNAQLDQTIFKNISVGSTDKFTVDSKITVTDGINEVELYYVAIGGYTGGNNAILDLINGNYPLIRVSDVEKYVEPTPTPEPPVYEDAVLKDEGTGIIISGSMPEDTNLSVETKELTDETINDEIYPLGEHTKVYNIVLTKDSQEITLDGELNVLIPEDELGFELRTGYFLYQVYEGGSVKVTGPIVYTGGPVNLTIDAGACLIYTDPFTDANSVNWVKYFNKDKVTVYDSPLSIAKTYEVKDATRSSFVVDYYFVDKAGTTWYMATNLIYKELGSDYFFVKAEDTSDERVVIPDITITDEENNTGVSIIGKLPAGTTATIKRLTEIDGNIDTSMYPMGENPFILDITLYDKDGNVTQPDSPVDVVIPAEYFAGNEGKFYIGYHVHDGEIDVLGPYEYTGDDIYVTVDEFSYIIFGEGYIEETIEPAYQAVFTSDTITFFRDHISTSLDEENAVTINVTENDIVEVYMMYTFDDGTVKYALDYKLKEGDENFNPVLYDIISDFSTPVKNIVLADSIKKYVKPVEQTLVDPVTGISVDGMFPSGAFLSVTALAKESLNLGANYPLGANVSAFDIKVIYGTEEFQPEGDVTLKLPAKNFNFNLKSAFNLYHKHGDTVSVIGPVVYVGGDLSFTISGFSQFVFTDTYADANSIQWPFHFTNTGATLYSSPLPGATTYVPAAVEVDGEPLQGDYIAEFYYVDTTGIKWFAFANNRYDDFDTDYIFVKEADISFDDRVVDFTDAAKTVTSMSGTQLEQQTMSYAALRKNAIMPLADAEYERLDNAGIHSSKTVTYDDKEKKYWVNIESYVTGTTTEDTIAVELPTDIILVLDQSGSMEQSTMTVSRRYEITGTANDVHILSHYASYMGDVYVKTGDNSYEKLSITHLSGTATEGSTYVPYHSLNNYTGENGDFHSYDAGNNLFIDLGGGEPVQVFVERTGRYSYSYRYYYEGENNQRQYLGTTDEKNGDSYIAGEDTVPSFARQLLKKVDGDIYSTYIFTYGNTTRTFNGTEAIPAGTYYTQFSQSVTYLGALQNAVRTFVDEVAKKAAGANGVLDGDAEDSDDITHTISVVGFARGTSSWPDYYLNTEIFDGATEYVYNAGGANDANDADAAQKHYADAVQDMTVQEDINKVHQSINKLAAKGATRVDLGIELANGIFAKLLNDDSQRYVKNGEVIRQKVVVVFTDGSPASQSSYDGTVANNAVRMAYATKNTHKATVYTIGIFSGANGSNPTSLPNNTNSGSNRENRFMHLVSSNYPSAISMTSTGNIAANLSGKSFYLSASDGDKLNNIFQEISQQIQHGLSSVPLGSTTVVQDVISPYFDLPSNASGDIQLSTYSRVKNGTTFSWQQDNPIYGTPTATVDQSTKTVQVTGFDFAKNYVDETKGRASADDDETAGNFYGRKLVIKFEIVPEDGFLGGNGVPTNDASNSGIYVPGKGGVADKWYENFEEPKANVEIDSVIGLQVTDKHVYYGSSLTQEQLIAGTVATTGGVQIYPEYNGTEGFDDFVTISTNEPTGINNITRDDSYEITVSVSPTDVGRDENGKLYPGVLAETKSQSENANIYVYSPVVPLKDTITYYGSTIDLQTTIDSENITWERLSTGSKLPQNAVMTGTEPQYRGFGFETVDVIESDVLPGSVSSKLVKTPDDIPAQITQIIFGATNLVKVARLVKDTDCTKRSGIDFVIHVKEVELKISKTVLGVNGFKPAGDKFTFTFTSEDALDVKLNYTVNKTSNNEYVTSGTISIGDTLTLEDDQYALITGMPIGTYRVTEADTAGYERKIPEGVTYIENSLGVDKEEGVAAFTNQLLTTSLVLSKKVSSIPNGLEDFVSDKEFKFKISVDGMTASTELIYTGSKEGKIKNGEIVTLGHGQSITFESLPVGATYTITEEDHSMFDAISPEVNGIKGKAAGTLSATSDNKVEFINKISVGKLTIVKEVVAPSYVDVSGDTFTFTVTHPSTAELTYNVYSSSNNELVSGNLTFTANTATVVLRDGQYAVIENIPVGNYSVVEADTAGRYTVTTTDDSGTITPTGATAEFVNTLNLYDLTITKEVNGNLYNAADTFIFNVSGPYGFTKEIVIAGENSVTIKGLPYGEYTVVEDTNWSFRYNATKVTQEVILDRNKNVTIENTPKSDNKWLDSAAYAENIFNIFSHQRITKKGVDKNE